MSENISNIPEGDGSGDCAGTLGDGRGDTCGGKGLPIGTEYHSESHRQVPATTVDDWPWPDGHL